MLKLILIAILAQALAKPTNKSVPCFEPKETAVFNMDWFLTVKYWYYPLMSREELYKGAWDLYPGNRSDLTWDQIYNEFCPRYWVENGMYVGTGFGYTKNLTYQTRSVKGMTVLEFIPNDPEGLFKGLCHVTFTDNKTYGVYICCMGDEMTWGSQSALKELPQESVETVYNHVESLGFPRDQFTKLSYKSCPVFPPEENLKFKKTIK